MFTYRIQAYFRRFKKERRHQEIFQKSAQDNVPFFNRHREVSKLQKTGLLRNRRLSSRTVLQIVNEDFISWDTQNAQDAVSPSQHSPGKSPVPLPSTAKTTLSGPVRSCDTQNAQDAVSPSQHSPGKSPVPLLGTAKTTLSGPARSCDTQNAQDNDSPSQHSPWKSPVPLPSTSKDTLSGPVRSCDTQNAQDNDSVSQFN